MAGNCLSKRSQLQHGTDLICGSKMVYIPEAKFVCLTCLRFSHLHFRRTNTTKNCCFGSFIRKTFVYVTRLAKQIPLIMFHFGNFFIRTPLLILLRPLLVSREQKTTKKTAGLVAVVVINTRVGKISRILRNLLANL